MSGLESLIQNIEFQANTKVLDVIVAKIKSVKKATDSLKASSPKVQAMLDKNTGMGLFAEMSAKNSKTSLAGQGIKARLEEEQRIIKERVEKARKYFKEFDREVQKSIKKREQDEKRLADKMKGFRMEFLGIMFAGQALQRFFGGLFKDMLKFFKGIAGSTNPLNKSLTALEANFSFLKYSIIEAMSGPIMAFTDLMISFISFLTDQDPAVLEAIGVAIVAIATAGALMFVGGQTALAANSIGMFLANMKDGTYGKALSGFVSKDLPAFKDGIMKILGGALTIYAGLKLLDFLTDSTGKKITITEAITSAGMLGAGVGMIWGSRAGVWAFWISVGLELVKQPDLFGSFLLDVIDVIAKMRALFGGLFLWMAANMSAALTPGKSMDDVASFGEFVKAAKELDAKNMDADRKWVTESFITPFSEMPAVVDAAGTSLASFSTDVVGASLVPNFTKLNGESVYMSANFQYATKTAMPQLVSQSILTCSQIDRQTESTLAAARAQERWNKALANKPKPGSSSSSASFSSAFGNTGSVGA